MRRLLPLLVGLGACEPPSDVEPLACRNVEPGVAELGVGDLVSGFSPLAEGDDLFISFGPQGMHMIIVAVRVTNLEAPQGGTLGTDLSISMIQEGRVVGGTINQLEPMLSGDISDFLGVRAIITEAEVDEMEDRDALVGAEVVDGCGRALSASVSVVLRQ